MHITFDVLYSWTDILRSCKPTNAYHRFVTFNIFVETLQMIFHYILLQIKNRSLGRGLGEHVMLW